MRFTNDGVHLSYHDLAMLAAQQDAERALVVRRLKDALEAEPDELERMRCEYSAHLVAVRAENSQVPLPRVRPPDVRFMVTRTELAGMIRKELEENNARWKELARKILYADAAALNRMRAADQHRQLRWVASGSLPRRKP